MIPIQQGHTYIATPWSAATTASQMTKSIAKQWLDAAFCFAHSYASWERGASENVNGLIRQFFPKKKRFDSITSQDIAFAAHRLNHRPRKCLGCKTPHEIFMKQLHSPHKTPSHFRLESAKAFNRVL
jgi:hypothetical protein